MKDDTELELSLRVIKARGDKGIRCDVNSTEKLIVILADLLRQ